MIIEKSLTTKELLGVLLALKDEYKYLQLEANIMPFADIESGCTIYEITWRNAVEIEVSKGFLWMSFTDSKEYRVNSVQDWIKILEEMDNLPIMVMELKDKGEIHNWPQRFKPMTALSASEGLDTIYIG